MPSRPTSTLLRMLRELRHPLATLAMVLAVANVVVPAAMAASIGAPGVLCLDLQSDDDAAAVACERCCLAAVTLVPAPVAKIACPVANAIPASLVHSSALAPALRDLSIAKPRGPPPTI